MAVIFVVAGNEIFGWLVIGGLWRLVVVFSSWFELEGLECRIFSIIMLFVSCLLYFYLSFRVVRGVSFFCLCFTLISCLLYFIRSRVLGLFIGFESMLWGLVLMILLRSGYQERLFTVKVLVAFTVVFSIPFLILVIMRFREGALVGV